MRYTESKEHSAEILRMVLPKIAQHGGWYYPTTYSLWYEYIAGMNPGLKDAVDERTANGALLTTDDVQRLVAKHILARDLQSAEKLQAELGLLIRSLGEIAARASSGSGAYAKSLQDVEQQLGESLDLDALRSVVRRLIENTTQQRLASEELRNRIDESQREIATLKEQILRVQSEALTDPLTSLHNRRGFERAVDAIAVTRPGGLAGCTVLVADIDHFKRVNDQYGHLLGDQVIRTVARALHSTIKGRDLVSRWGGEEFAIFLPDTDSEGGLALAEQIRTTIMRGRIRRTGRADFIDQVTISIGVATATPEECLEHAIERADEALYAAKNAGRNCVRVAPAVKLVPDGPPPQIAVKPATV